MKVNSTVNPSKFYIRKVNLGVAYVRLRKNVVEDLDEEDNTIFDYDEVEVGISDRSNLNQFIEDNFEVLFEMGLQEENKPKPLSIDEKINKLEVENAEMEMEIMLTISMLLGGE